jgi:hypothetical protein
MLSIVLLWAMALIGYRIYDKIKDAEKEKHTREIIQEIRAAAEEERRTERHELSVLNAPSTETVEPLVVKPKPFA